MSNVELSDENWDDDGEVEGREGNGINNTCVSSLETWV